MTGQGKARTYTRSVCPQSLLFLRICPEEREVNFSAWLQGPWQEGELPTAEAAPQCTGCEHPIPFFFFKVNLFILIQRLGVGEHRIPGGIQAERVEFPSRVSVGCEVAGMSQGEVCLGEGWPDEDQWTQGRGRGGSEVLVGERMGRM